MSTTKIYRIYSVSPPQCSLWPLVTNYVLLYSTLLCKNNTRAPGGHKTYTRAPGGHKTYTRAPGGHETYIPTKLGGGGGGGGQIRFRISYVFRLFNIHSTSTIIYPINHSQNESLSQLHGRQETETGRETTSCQFGARWSVAQDGGQWGVWNRSETGRGQNQWSRRRRHYGSRGKESALNLYFHYGMFPHPPPI